MTQQAMSGTGGESSINSATTVYSPWAQAINGQAGVFATEADTKLKNRGACTLLNCRAYVNTNSRSGGSTVKNRLNGADGAVTVSITGSTTGLFTDLVHSDSLADGDLFGMASVTT